MEKSSPDSKKSKIIEDVMKGFIEQLESAAEKLDEPIRRINILIVDSCAVPKKELDLCFDLYKAEAVEIASAPFKTLYDSLTQYADAEKVKWLVKKTIEDHFSDFDFSAIDLKKEILNYLSLGK